MRINRHDNRKSIAIDFFGVLSRTVVLYIIQSFIPQVYIVCLFKKIYLIRLYANTFAGTD